MARKIQPFPSRQEASLGFVRVGPDSPFKSFSMRQEPSFPTVSGSRNSDLALDVPVVLIRGINDDLTLFARTRAFAADAGFFFQNKVQDAPFAR